MIVIGIAVTNVLTHALEVAGVNVDQIVLALVPQTAALVLA